MLNTERALGNQTLKDIIDRKRKEEWNVIE